MQSGIQRKTYTLGPCPPEVAARFYSGTVKRSDRSITGLATDSLNSVVIANTLDGTLNVGLHAAHYIYIDLNNRFLHSSSTSRRRIWNIHWCCHHQPRQYFCIATMGSLPLYAMTWSSVSWISKLEGLSES